MASIRPPKPSLCHRRSFRIAVAAVMFLGVGATLRAVTVLDNTFDAATPGLSILKRELTPTDWYATPFTTDGFAYKLNSIKADIEDFGPSVGLFLEIWGVNTLTGGPSSSLGRLQLIDTGFPKEFEANIVFGEIFLSANTSYYVVTGVDNGGGSYREQINFADPPGPYFNVESGDWLLETVLPGLTNQMSFRSTTEGSNWQESGLLTAPTRMIVDASVVPEPSVWALLLFSGLGLFIHAVRRRV